MRIFRILLSGAPIEDVFIYRTQLYCWTFDQRLRIYNVSDIEDAIERYEVDRGPGVCYALFHSRGIGASARQVMSWRSFSAMPPNYLDPIVIDSESVPYREIPARIDADALLDLLIYYDTLYFATRNGLFVLDLAENRGDFTSIVVPVARIREACYSTSAGLGAVGASCGPAGLRLLFGGIEVNGSEPPPVKKVSDISIRSDIGYGSVVNYPSRSEYEFLSGPIIATARGGMLTDVSPSRVLVSSELRESTSAGVTEGEYVLWDRSRLLVFEDEEVWSLSVVRSADVRKLNRRRDVASYGELVGRIISVVRIGRSFALESDKALVLISSNDHQVVSTGPVIALRSYPRSHRYQRLATATSEQGVWMLAVDGGDEA